MTFANKSRYDRILQQVTQKGGESAMNYIKIFQNVQALSVSVLNSYSEDQLMNIFFDNFHQGQKYIAHIESHQSEFRIEVKMSQKQYLSITSLHTGYLNLYRSSGSGKNNEREDTDKTKFTFCGGTNHSTDFFLKY